jgi:hypothetical protein
VRLRLDNLFIKQRPPDRRFRRLTWTKGAAAFPGLVTAGPDVTSGAFGRVRGPAFDNHLAAQGAPGEVTEALLSGRTLRGVTDEELGGLETPVGVLPSAFANPFHQRITVDALLGLLPGASELPACPEPPRPEFPPYLGAFADAVARFAVRAS